jgi:hypothetical protein
MSYSFLFYVMIAWISYWKICILHVYVYIFKKFKKKLYFLFFIWKQEEFIPLVK